MTPWEFLGHLARVVALAGIGPLVAAGLMAIGTGIAPIRRRDRQRSRTRSLP